MLEVDRNRPTVVLRPNNVRNSADTANVRRGSKAILGIGTGTVELFTGIQMLASAAPKIRKHRLASPITPNGVEQAKVYWQS